MYLINFDLWHKCVTEMSWWPVSLLHLLYALLLRIWAAKLSVRAANLDRWASEGPLVFSNSTLTLNGPNFPLCSDVFFSKRPGSRHIYFIFGFSCVSVRIFSALQCSIFERNFELFFETLFQGKSLVLFQSISSFISVVRVFDCEKLVYDWLFRTFSVGLIGTLF